MSYAIHLPSYSIGTDVYQEIGEICRPYGTKVVAIGGKRAIAAVKEKLVAALEESGLEILGFLWYGGEAGYEQVEALESERWLKQAEMIFAVGGGKALDTAKLLGYRVNKPVFTFPTIASNCSACTSVSILYRPDGSFLQPYFFQQPPVHAFIDTQVIAASPSRYMWAGMGDTYAKYFESTVSSRGEKIPHYISLGLANSLTCYQPIIQYGQKALTDAKASYASWEFEQVVLSVIVSTGVASILLCTDHVIDYNTGLAHAFYYALTSFPQTEQHLHGEIVAFGVLVLLLADKDMEHFHQVYRFHQKVGLPTKLTQLGIYKEEFLQVAKQASAMKDIEHYPYPVTEEMLIDAFLTLEEMK
ncbi:MAG: iron-containing alcohol dehydrogenase family protein [Clostridiales bacterium]|nr:iron-containing alcohol dehydrogenase family protein [Clostridiales bacterium]